MREAIGQVLRKEEVVWESRETILVESVEHVREKLEDLLRDKRIETFGFAQALMGQSEHN